MAISRILSLAGRSVPPHRVIEDVSNAALVIINGSSRQIVRFFIKVRRQQRAIVVGDSDYGSALRMCPRPLRVTELVGAVRAAIIEDIPVPTEEFSASFSPSMLGTTHNRSADRTTVSRVDFQFQNTAPDPVQEAVERASVAQVNTATQPRARAEVLIVDDSDIAALALSARLRKLSIVAHEASSGEDALAKTGINEYKIVFLDVNMPDIDGYAVCRAIKRRRVAGGPAPTIVMLTSRGGTIDKIRGKMVGCDAYLTKPLNDDTLRATLRSFSLIT